MTKLTRRDFLCLLALAPAALVARKLPQMAVAEDAPTVGETFDVQVSDALDEGDMFMGKPGNGIWYDASENTLTTLTLSDEHPELRGITGYVNGRYQVVVTRVSDTKTQQVDSFYGHQRYGLCSRDVWVELIPDDRLPVQPGDEISILMGHLVLTGLLEERKWQSCSPEVELKVTNSEFIEFSSIDDAMTLYRTKPMDTEAYKV